MSDILALDVGEKRIGIARASLIARLPEALEAIPNDGRIKEFLQNLIKQYSVKTIVVGLPRNMSGQETKQSQYTRSFIDENIPSDINVIWQDETLSSHQAMNNTGRLKNIDSEAACIILDDYLGNNS
jgi:putative holliday junction resolvase